MATNGRMQYDYNNFNVLATCLTKLGSYLLILARHSRTNHGLQIEMSAQVRVCIEKWILAKLSLN